MYPSYTRSERVADGSMHAIGVTGAVLGAIALLVWSVPVASPWEIAAISVYAITLIGTFTASALYHMTPWDSIRPVLRRIDHAAGRGPGAPNAGGQAGGSGVDELGMARRAQSSGPAGVPAGPDPRRLATNRGEDQVAKKPVSVEQEPGRNDPCPCGSGKKYKKCHGR